MRFMRFVTQSFGNITENEMKIVKYLLVSRFSWLDFLGIITIAELMSRYSFWLILLVIPCSIAVSLLEFSVLGETNRGAK